MMALRRATFSVVLCAAVAFLFACDSGAVTLLPIFPSLPVRSVREVIVDTWPFAIQVGDTMTVYTEAFDSTGTGTAGLALRTWALTDSTLATATPLGPHRSSALFRGQRPGSMLVRVTINGVTGQDSLRIIPTLAPLEISPTSLTLRQGDTAIVRLRIVDRSGNPVQNLVVLWNSADYSIAVPYCCRDSARVWSIPVVGRTGTTVISATVANSVVTMPVTVIPR